MSLARFRGHFYNWYDTQTLQRLEPMYVSTVDSGNLAAHLLTLRAGLLAMPDRPGELLRMLVPIAQANVNIIDVDVNRLDARPRMGERIVEICVAITGQQQADSLLVALNAKGYRVLVSRWQDPTVDRAGNVSRSTIMPDRASGHRTGDRPHE